MKHAAVPGLLVALILAVLTVAFVGRADDKAQTRLDRQAAALKRQRMQLRQLETFVCVLAHVPDNAEQIVVRDYVKRGRLDRAVVEPDYPDCVSAR